MASPKLIEKYGAYFPASASAFEIEKECILLGGTWTRPNGKQAGRGLEFHYQKLQEELWPHLDNHRWHKVCIENILKKKVCVLMGPKSSGKTHEAAKFALCECFLRPEETTVLISSTEERGLQLRIFGECKKLLKRAKELYPNLPGTVIDYRNAISMDDFLPEEGRDLRNGIIGVPCVVNNRFVGLGRFSGVKNKHVLLVADEAQFMQASFLQAITNLDGNENFRAIIIGNPIDPMDSLGRAAEPLDGWTQMDPPKTTTVWNTKFMDGVCVNLVGTDSPNFDFPESKKPKYPYLISQRSITPTLNTYGKESLQFSSQCEGVMRSGLISRRVITRDMCRQFGAIDNDNWTWFGGKRTKIYAVDAAYGNIGGDRCVGGWIEFGKETSGKTIICVHQPSIVPVSVKATDMPEDQIAKFVKSQCEANGIPPENVFHDATGRGSLGTAFARVWSPLVNPIEFGGRPTNRPVTLETYVQDSETHHMRLKRCDEHYSKFVTELWFSVRYAIESGQMRNLPLDVMEEGCMREWCIVRNDKIELETKEEMKERMGRSPDLFDWLCSAIEGARQKGFEISKLGDEAESSSSMDWYYDLALKQRERKRHHNLSYA